MDKVQLSVAMAHIAEKLEIQLATPEDQKFSILAVTDEMYNNKFIWEIGIKGSRICYIDNYLHLRLFTNRMWENSKYGNNILYYMWDKELIYPFLERSVTRFLVDELEKYMLYDKMVNIIEETMGRFIINYPYSEVQFAIDTKGEVPFVWLIGIKGSHIYRMDEPEQLKTMISNLDSVTDIRKSYKCYVYGGIEIKPVHPKTVRKDVQKLLEELQNPE